MGWPPGSIREFAGELDPFAVRGEALVGFPVDARVDRAAHFLEGHRQIEMRVGIVGVQREGIAVRLFRLRVLAMIVTDVPEVEMRLEIRVVQRDRPRILGLIRAASPCSVPRLPSARAN